MSWIDRADEIDSRYSDVEHETFSREEFAGETNTETPLRAWHVDTEAQARYLATSYTEGTSGNAFFDSVVSDVVIYFVPEGTAYQKYDRDTKTWEVVYADKGGVWAVDIYGDVSVYPG